MENKPPGPVGGSSVCNHKFIFMETIKYFNNSPYGASWHRTDIFYCEKCLEFKEIARVERSRGRPTWY